MKKPYLSIVIPCYNEEKRLEPGLKKTIKYLEQQVFDYELIFVNDGSTDKTLDLLQKIKSKRDKVTVISYYPNYGKGYAVRKGVLASRGKWVLICDADFSIPIEHLEVFLQNVKENKVIVGSKKLSNSRAVEKQILRRRFLGRGFTKLTNIVLGTNISDITCGFKLFKGEVARRILAKQLIHDWSYDAETFFLLRRFDYRVFEIPVKWHDVKGSKVKIINSIMASFLGLIRIRLNDLWGKYEKQNSKLKTQNHSSKVKTFSIDYYSLLSLTLLLLVLIPLFLKPQILTNRGTDFSEQVWPSAYFFKQSILQHRQIPIINPYILAGVPFFADPQNLMFYPPNWLLLLISLDFGLVLLLFLHLIFAGLTFFYFVRNEWSRPWQSGLVAALIYSLSPFFWAEMIEGHYNMILAFSWVPALFWLLWRFKQRPKLRLSIVLAIVLSFIYVNYVSIFYFTSLTGSVFVLGEWFRSKRWHNFKYLLAALVLFAGFSAIAILPQLELASLTTRSKMAFPEVALPVWSMSLFVQSVIFPFKIGINKIQTGAYLYLGIVPTILAALGWLRLKRNWQVVSLILLILVGLFVLGSRTPFYGFVYQFLPGVKFLRITSRAWFLIVLAISLLATKAKPSKLMMALMMAELLVVNLIRLEPLNFKALPENKELIVFLKKDNDVFRIYCPDHCLSQRQVVANNIYTVHGYAAFQLLDYVDYLQKAGNFNFQGFSGYWPPYQVFLNQKTQPKADLLAEMEVKYVLTRYPLTDFDFEAVAMIDGYYAYKNKRFINGSKLTLLPMAVKLENSNMPSLGTAISLLTLAIMVFLWQRF